MLFLIAACSCVVLIGAAVALWLSIRREREAAEVEPHAFREALQQARHQPHPRMDLAAGIAAGIPQRVHAAARRRGLALDIEAEAAAEIAAAKLARAAGAVVRRDWAYYKEDMGDLSDPDLRRAPAGGVRRPLGTLSIPESR